MAQPGTTIRIAVVVALIAGGMAFLAFGIGVAAKSHPQVGIAVVAGGIALIAGGIAVIKTSRAFAAIAFVAGGIALIAIVTAAARYTILLD